MKFICSIVLVLFFLQSVKSQELYGKYLNHEQGLLSNECYDINYDEKGYLIVGTPYGPMKYDGERFIPICTNLSMERLVMYDFEKSPDGTVYMFNSKNEIFKLQNDNAIWIGPKNLSEFLKNDRGFIKLYYANDGLYISTFTSYVKYSFKTQIVKSFHRYDKSNSDFTYNSKASFPFTKTYGENIVNSLVKIEFPEYKQLFNFTDIMVADSREDRITVGNTTYLLISQKLFKKTGNRVISMNFKNILFFNYFHGRLWLCTYDGLIELDSAGNFIHHHFKGETIGGVVPLKPRGIAISLNQKGIFISSDIDNRIHTNFTPTSSAKIQRTSLVGNSKGELFKYTDYKLKRITRVKPLNSNLRVADLGIFDISLYKNYLKLTTAKGVLLLTPDFRKKKTIQEDKYGFFETFTNKEDIYFIGRRGFLKMNWNKFKTLPFLSYDYLSIYLKEIRCHALLNDSIMLFGSNKGLIKFNLNSNHYSYLHLFKKELRVVGIHVFNENKFLVCTRFNGIYVIHKNKIIRKIQTPCIAASGILFYKNQLIVRGNDGIYIQRLDQPENTPWNKLFSGEAENMFELDNNLLIAYKKDLIIKVLSDKRSVFRPKIVLNKFLQGDVEMSRFPLVIPPNKSISVDVDILQFDANKLDLYYKLRGENTISQQIEGTKINFDALKSGSYSLEIYPVIDGKIQFNNSRTFHFNIEETFWESTIFYIVAGILLISVIISILLIINLRRKRRIAQRAELESKLNEYKLLAVKAQVNPHFLSNGLAAIQALILKGDNDNAAHYLAKFSFLMRKILYYSETQFISVEQEIQLIDAYLELELLRFQNRFKIQREIQLSEIQLKEFQFPSLLLQPILENAIWHGLKFQENNPELRISFQINQKQELVVQISDNGYGFSTSNRNEEHMSKGNQLINERIDALNQQFQKQVASIEVESTTSGTTVTFTFSSLLYQSVKI